MFIPLGTNRPIRRPTLVVYWLIGINIAVHIAMMALERWSPGTYLSVLRGGWLSASPGAPLTVWGALTYQFLHGGVLHLAGNMVFLWVFGPNIEDRLGRWSFLAFYLVGGAFAGGVHLVFEGAPVIGASGSVSALTGAYLVLFPKTVVRVLVFFFFIGVFGLPAWVFIAFGVFWDFVGYGAGEVGGGSGIAHLAHIGGYAYGAGVSFAMLWWGVISREPYDLFSMGKQAKRRRRYRELVARQGRGGWTSEAPASSVPGKGGGRRSGSAGEDDRVASARGAVTRLVTAGELDGAVTRYREMVREFGERALPRDAQLAVANHLSAGGDAQNAASAYRVFLERYGRDPEVDRVRLMLALLTARHLNDPIAASELIGAVRRDRLTVEERSVLEALEKEVG